MNKFIKTRHRVPLVTLLTGLIFLIGASLNSYAEDEFLNVEDAFKLETNIQADNLLLTWKIAPDYYLYQSRFKILTPDGKSLPAEYTKGHVKFDPYLEEKVEIHEGSVTATIPMSSLTEQTVVRTVYQGCATAGLCYPPHSQYLEIDPTGKNITFTSSDVYDAAQSAMAPTGDSAASAPEAQSFISALIFAFIGGMILNLMPCVFPVLSIKVISLAQADRSHLASHGWAYTIGIEICFLAFAIILMVARAGGEAIGWGFQLQSPYLITALAYLFFVMGLSLSGMLNIGTSWMGAGQNLTQKSGLSGSFFTGVLAAIVASPCTAPFMGVALGYALTQPGVYSLGVFASLAFGMAFPMLLLCYFPKLVDKLPRPGTWMETLKEVLAFPLYLTSIWLLWVLARQASINAAILVCVGAVFITFGVWLFNRPTTGIAQNIRRVAMFSAWILAIAMPTRLISASDGGYQWESYSADKLAEARSDGKPVFVNLTADWCITCLANERVALGTEDVENLLEEKGIVSLKGDWTNRDPEITKLLNEYGRSGVPLYLWIPPGHEGKAIVLPQLLSKSEIIDTLSNTTL